MDLRSALGVTDRRGFAVPVLQSLVIGVVFLASALLAYRHPVPRHAPLLVVGSPASAAAFQSRLATGDGGSWDVRAVPDRQQALEALRDGAAFGAVDPAGRQLLYAGANGPTVTAAVTAAVPASLASALRPVDVLPLGANDAAGLPLFYLCFAVVLASYLFTVASMVLGARLPARGHWLSAVLLAVLLGVAGAATARWVTGTVTDHVAETALVLVLLSLATSSGAWLVTAAFGAAGSVAASLVLVILASVSGGVVPGEFLPRWAALLRPALPQGAGLSALRDFVYFHGTGAGSHLLVLAGWALLPLAVAGPVGSYLRRRRRRPAHVPAPPASSVATAALDH